jgi:hypothetical protein
MLVPGALSLFPFTKRPLLLEGAGSYREDRLKLVKIVHLGHALALRLLHPTPYPTPVSSIPFPLLPIRTPGRIQEPYPPAGHTKHVMSGSVRSASRVAPVRYGRGWR